MRNGASLCCLRSQKNCTQTKNVLRELENLMTSITLKLKYLFTVNEALNPKPDFEDNLTNTTGV